MLLFVNFSQQILLIIFMNLSYIKLVSYPLVGAKD